MPLSTIEFRSIWIEQYSHSIALSELVFSLVVGCVRELFVSFSGTFAVLEPAEIDSVASLVFEHSTTVEQTVGEGALFVVTFQCIAMILEKNGQVNSTSWSMVVFELITITATSSCRVDRSINKRQTPLPMDLILKELSRILHC